MSVEAARAHNEMVLAKLEPGDAVTFDGGLYRHYALYIGEGLVIHLTGTDPEGVNSNSGHICTTSGQRVIKREELVNAAGNSMAYKRISRFRSRIPISSKKSVNEVIDTATSMLGQIRDDLVWTSCEHFVNFCIYGVKKSKQSNITVPPEVMEENKTVLKSLEPGDAVEFRRSLFSHFALYVGEGQVIHLTAADPEEVNSMFGHTCTTSGQRVMNTVKLEDFFDVAGNSVALKRINRLRSRIPISSKKSVNEVIDTATSMLGPIRDDLVWTSCEHFVNFCIYGVKKSKQNHVSPAVMRDNETLRETLMPGDAVAFPRGSYSHWALYVGEGLVIHVAGDDRLDSNSGHIFTVSGKRYNKAWVKLDDFFHVAGNSKAVRWEPPFRLSNVDEIIDTATSKLEKPGYNLLWNNCEHFVNECITGFKISYQVVSLPAKIVQCAFGSIPMPNRMRAVFTSVLVGLTFNLLPATFVNICRKTRHQKY